MIATNSGLRIVSTGWSAKATTTASPNDTTNAIEIVPMRPRRRVGSISSPARKSRNASPSRESTTTGRSMSSQPSPDGPTMTPMTISSATGGHPHLGREVDENRREQRDDGDHEDRAERDRRVGELGLLLRQAPAEARSADTVGRGVFRRSGGRSEIGARAEAGARRSAEEQSRERARSADGVETGHDAGATRRSEARSDPGSIVNGPMQTTVEPLEDNRVKLHVAVPAEEFEPAINAAFRKLAERGADPGLPARQGAASHPRGPLRPRGRA